jgi:sialate O-acetylesterase
MMRYLLLFICCLIYQSTYAGIRFGSLFSDGMVLQQKSIVKIWGWTNALSKITVHTSWDKRAQTAPSDSNGYWQIFLKTPKGNFKNHNLTFSDGHSISCIKNVMIGEVWIASGQSNMEMPLQGFDNCPIENAAKYIQDAAQYNGRIRFAQIARIPSLTPLDTTKAIWTNCDPQSAKNFSAVGFFFATHLEEKLNCPIGIISCNYGGSRVEGWTPRDLAATYQGLDLSDSALSHIQQQTPVVMYNGMIHPIAGYTIKGFIWYQGEANVENYDDYAKRLHNMILRWRQEWHRNNLPFLSVEIAPCIYRGRANGRAPRLREAQWIATHTTNNTFTICTNDLVQPEEEFQIHPSDKFSIGLRLSNLALNKIYKKSKEPANYPEFKKIQFKENKAILSFTNTKNGFSITDRIVGFEICGNDNIYVPALAVVKGNLVEVSADKVRQPQKVRYAFKDFEIGNLKNREGLPVVPFRSRL